MKPSASTPLRLAGIEAGGTKFVCAVGSGPEDLRTETRFPTTAPAATLAQAVDFLKQAEEDSGPLDAIGVAAFGPLSPDPAAPDYGHIRATPKPGWSDTDVVGALRRHFAQPIAFDTDVNGAALGEWRWGAAQGLASFAYITIGTGIGAGLFANGEVVHGLTHPEMGHIPLPRDAIADPFEGACPFHGDCFEGLASGPAIEKRWGEPAESLPPEHPAWELEAHYIALALRTLICTFSPQRIVIGGGVMGQPQLMPLIRAKTQVSLNGYVQSPQILERIEEHIVPPALGGRAGVLGALVLAERALERTARKEHLSA